MSYANPDTMTTGLRRERGERVVRNKRCRWRLGTHGEYNTSCGNAFALNDGTPDSNNFKFCCYCGGLLKAVPSQVTEEKP